MDIPDKLELLAIVILIGVLINPIYAKAPDNIETERMVIVNSSAIKAVNTPIFSVKFAPLGGLIGEVDAYYLYLEKLPQIKEIIKECESKGNPNVCNAEYGCTGGQGLYQLIPTTLKYCEVKLKRQLDAFNPKDNEECAYWLAENEGLDHWGKEDTWWGSYNCWFLKVLNVIKVN